MTIPAIPIGRIYANPDNIRDELGDLTELTASIRAVGLLQPITVRPDGRGRFVIIDGERRYHAARAAGLNVLPCLASKASTPAEQIEVMLAFAMHKELAPVEQSRAFRALRNRGLSVSDIARRTGYSVATVSGRMLLADLPVEVQDKVAGGELTVTDATRVARQVRATSSGSAVLRGPRASYLDGTHPLAAGVRDACTHADVRTVIGRVGCGQCWEDAIRADERAHSKIGVPR